MKRSRGIRSVSLSSFLTGVLLFAFSSVAFGAQWAKLYKSWSGESIEQTSDGGYVVAGSQYLPTLNAAGPLVLRLDKEGDISWQKTYGEGFGHFAMQTSDGGYLLLGGSQASNWAGFLLKLDGEGNVQWKKVYSGLGDTIIPSVRQTSDGGYILVGSTNSGGANVSDSWVLKLDANGNAIWQKAYRGSGNGYAHAILETPDGGYIFAGEVYVGASNWDGLLVKLDGNGNIQWRKAFGGPGEDKFSDMQPTSDGGYILLGGLSPSGDITGSGTWVLKLDRNANVEWQKTYNDAASGYGAIRQTLDGGYILTGSSVTGLFSYGASVLRLNADGSVAWQKSFGRGETHAYSALQAPDGGYVIVGVTDHSFDDLTGTFVAELGTGGDIPDCPIFQSFVTTVIDTNATGKDANVVDINTAFGPTPDTVTPLDANIAVDTLCFSPIPSGVTIDPSVIDFGGIVVGSFNERVLTIANQGNENVMIDTISNPQAPFFTIEDVCSGQNLSPGKDCKLTIRFSPAYGGNNQVHFDISFRGSKKSVIAVWLLGAGELIALSSPLDTASFGACSLYSPVTFSWATGDVFKDYKIQFSPDDDFTSSVLNVKSPGPTKDIDSRTWKKILSIPGGIVYWRVVGERVNRTTAESDVGTIKIEDVQPVGNPIISPASGRPLPELSWNNNCNIQFRVWFGSDDQFSKKYTLMFKVNNPSANDGKFDKILNMNQLKSIQRIAVNPTDPVIYWYVESWDGLGRYAKTDVMSFVLVDLVAD